MTGEAPDYPILPAAQQALDRYVKRHDGDLSDTVYLADSIYRAGWEDCMQSMRAFSPMTDLIVRLNEMMESMHQRWIEMGERRD